MLSLTIIELVTEYERGERSAAETLNKIKKLAELDFEPFAAQEPEEQCFFGFMQEEPEDGNFYG